MWRWTALIPVFITVSYSLSSISSLLVTVSWEKAANKALVAAKQQVKEHPNDQRRAQRYEKLKQDYKAAAAAKKALGLTAPKTPLKVCRQWQQEASCRYGDKCRFSHMDTKHVDAAVEDEWTCKLCAITMPSSEREVHCNTKRHKKAVNCADAEKLMWSCAVCQIRIAAAARDTHLHGKKHQAKMVSAKPGHMHVAHPLPT